MLLQYIKQLLTFIPEAPQQESVVTSKETQKTPVKEIKKNIPGTRITIIEPQIIPTREDCLINDDNVRACHELEEHVISKHAKSKAFLIDLVIPTHTTHIHMPCIAKIRIGLINGFTNKVISLSPLTDLVVNDETLLRQAHIYHIVSSKSDQNSMTQQSMLTNLDTIKAAKKRHFYFNDSMEPVLSQPTVFEVQDKKCLFILDREYNCNHLTPAVMTKIANTAF